MTALVQSLIRKSLITTFFCLAIGLNSKAQSVIIDSLRNELQQTDNIIEQIDIRIYLAHHFAHFNFDSAKYYSNSIITISKEINDNENLCHGYLKYALAYFGHCANSCMDSCWQYLDSAYTVATNSNYAHGLTVYYQFVAVLHENFNEPEKAIENYLLALDRAKIEKDTNTIAYCIYNIANLYQESGNLEKALAQINNNFILESVKDDPIYYTLINLLGRIQFDLKDFDKSILYNKEAYYNYYSLSSIVQKMEGLQRLGYVYYYAGKIDSADIYFNEVLEILELRSNNYLLDNDFYRLSEYLIFKKDFKNAEFYLLHSLNHSRTSVSSTLELYTLKLLVDLHKAKKEYNKALDYTEKHTVLRDSLQMEGLGSLIDKALLSQDIRNYKTELTLLKEQQDNMIKRNTIILIIALLSFLLLCIIKFYQARILYSFQQDNKSPGLKTIWNYVLPPLEIKYKQNVLASFIFAFINLVLLISLVNYEHNISILLTWFLSSAILFFGIKLPFTAYQLKQSKFTLKDELILQLVYCIINAAIIVVVHNLLWNTIFNFAHTFHLLLLVLSSFFITLIVTSSIRYRNIIDLLQKNMLSDFNKKLHDKQVSIEKKEEIQTKDKITVDNLGKALEISVDNIIYIASENVYQEFFCFENNKITKTLVRNTLNNIEKTLEEFPQFSRCHRSYIVNTNKVITMDGAAQKYYFVLKHTDTKIPVSRSAAKEIMDTFSSILA